MFNNLAQIAYQGYEKLRYVAYQIFVENLAPELQKLQRSDMISVQPVVYFPCCSFSQLPQFFYKILIGEEVIAHIMHGRQNAYKVYCDQMCTGCFSSLCGKYAGLACYLVCRNCSRGCKCFCECLACKPVSYCCKHLTSYVDSVQQFEDYENALEVRQTITPLGWGHSEKDGLYVGRTEFAIGAFYESTPQYAVDWAAYYIARSGFTSQAAALGAGNTVGGALTTAQTAVDLSNPPGIPIVQDEDYEYIYTVFACLQCYPVESYLQVAQTQWPLLQTYAVHYYQKYLGRYIYGCRRKELLQAFCFCAAAPAYLGYTYLDDFYVLDNFDNLLFRCTMAPLAYCDAFTDAPKGEMYRIEIKDPNDYIVGSVIKRKFTSCCGLKFYWTFDVALPRTATPIQKVLLSYLVPFLNEKWMDIWSPGDSHEISDIKHDRQYAEMQYGSNNVIFDRLVDYMSYKNISATDVPKLLAAITVTNPSRLEGQAIRYSSYGRSKALQREYVRRRRIDAKALLLQYILEKEMQALETLDAAKK